eukprot:Selendium_serpulae@DN6519_c1_g1_i20.p1
MIRDVIQHLPLKLGINSLENIRQSGAAYLIVSNFPSNLFHRSKINQDTFVGGYHKNDVYRRPYDVLQLSPPLEACKNHNGIHGDPGSQLLFIPLKVNRQMNNEWF